MTIDEVIANDKKVRYKWMGYRRKAINTLDVHQFYLACDALEFIKKPDEELKARLLSRTELLMSTKDRLQKLNQRLGMTK